MIKIVDIYKFGAHCPTQWYGKDEATGLWIYFRYRFGNLSVEWSSTKKQIWAKAVGAKFDGIMSFEELKRHLMGEVYFCCPEREPTHEEIEAH